MLRLFACLSENDGLLACELGQNEDYICLLVLRRNEHIILHKLVNCLIFGVDFYLYWVFERCTLQLLHFRSHGGREEESVSLLWNLRED